MVFVLARRKNLPGGCTLKRGCWCSESAATCPLHVLGPYVEGLQPGAPLFPGMTPIKAQKALRGLLARAGVKDAGAAKQISRLAAPGLLLAALQEVIPLTISAEATQRICK